MNAPAPNVDVLQDGTCIAAIGDDALWALASTLHSNVPEADRPMGWSDFSPEQIQRLRDAGKAFLAIYLRQAASVGAEVPNYEAAAIALGFHKMDSGKWWAPNPLWHPSYMCRWDSAEAIFDSWWPDKPTASAEAEVAGEAVAWRYRQKAIPEMDWRYSATDMSSEVYLCEPLYLASPSRSEGGQTTLPDWKQDQAQTTRLKPRPQSEVLSATPESIRIELDSCRHAVATIEGNRTYSTTQNHNLSFYKGKVAGLEFALKAIPTLAQTSPVGDFYLVPREIIDEFPEINVNNYDHDDACALNSWGCEVVTNANPAGGPAIPSADRQPPICKFCDRPTLTECQSYGQATTACTFSSTHQNTQEV